MKLSFRIRLVIMTMATVIGAIVVTWVLNKYFLEMFYVGKQVGNLKSAYTEVCNVLDNYRDMQNDTDATALSYNDTFTQDEQNAVGFLSEEDTLTLKSICVRNNMSMYVIWNYDSMFTISNGESIERVVEEVSPYIISKRLGLEYANGKIYFSDKNGLYEVVESYERRTKTTYINLICDNIADNGSLIIIRTNLESMQEGVQAANTFLIYAGLLVLVITLFVTLFSARGMMKPIKELSSIAKEMTELNFEKKYEVKTYDEIGELGQSINTLSGKLEGTISDLKSANNRLKSDVEQKTQIDEMRKEFLSNVTHELKTPIALISGYAEGLKDCINDDAESREFYCDVIMDEAGKMNKMVQKLLTLNRIEFGNQMLELERFDLVAVIKAVIDSTEVLCRNKSITVQFDYSKPRFVWADEYMIEEVVTNYLTNAINHCANEMIIDIKTEERDNGTVRVSVFNSGNPIPYDETDKIWVKFYKVDKARTREYGGSGIGLSIVKAIMEAHNKDYGVINHSNGVEFYFELDAKS